MEIDPKSKLGNLKFYLTIFYTFIFVELVISKLRRTLELFSVRKFLLFDPFIRC